MKESIQNSTYDNNKTLGRILDEIGDRLVNVVEDFKSEPSSRVRDRERSHSRGRNNLRDDYRNRSRERNRDYSIDNYRDRDRGKSNSRNGSNGRRKHQISGTGQRNLDRYEFCHYCDITGHTTHRCFKLEDI